MAAATTSSPKTSPHRPNGLLDVTMRLSSATPSLAGAPLEFFAQHGLQQSP